MNMANTDRLEKLAGRLDQVIKTIEPYDYEGSAEEALNRLNDNPIGIIEYLVGMLEDIA
jgi:hypothetical protein